MKRLLIFFILLSIFNFSNATSENLNYPYLNSSLTYEDRVIDLMNRMTLEEKVAQMCQYVGLNYLAETSKK